MSDEGIKLKLPFIEDKDLPCVSIITPTRNKKLFKLAVYQFLKFDYPRHKLEWIILDNGTDRVKKYLDYKDDSNLIYMTLDGTKRYSIGELRNTCIEKASYDIIVYMDDDDFYPPESVVCRVKSLLKYFHRGIECVGVVDCLTYNIHDKSCDVSSNSSTYFLEASMCHTKRFWNKRKFNKDMCLEVKYFLRDRHKQMIAIPFQFVIIVFNHSNNFTGRGNRVIKKNDKLDNVQIGRAGNIQIMLKDNSYIDTILTDEIKKIIYEE